MVLARVVGVGITPYGAYPEKTILDLIVEAGLQALTDAGLGPDEIDACYIGNFAAESFIHQNHLGPLAGTALGLNGIPWTHVEGACASGSLAIREGILAIKSGLYKRVLVLGVEKMTHAPTAEVTAILSRAGNSKYETRQGVTFPSAFALIAQRHMFQFGTTREQMAAVAVKNHANALHNPTAHFHKKITIEDVLTSNRLVAEPLTVLDCSPASDGAAALVLCAPEVSTDSRKVPVDITGSGLATGYAALFQNKDITSLRAAKLAAEQAYAMAGITAKDIDFAEVHDCFTIAEIVATEDLGFFRAGHGGPAALEGLTGLDGELPVNPSGGLKAKGHPIGATGVGQMVEAVLQLQGKAGGRQVMGARLGLTHNLGGSGGTCTVHVLQRRDV